jgi:uncharacterized coiled-coil protein SlyX
MWTSRQPDRQIRPGLRRRALDAFGLAVVLGFLPELVGAHAGLVFQPHPGWIAVLVLAALYGSGGLFTGLIAAAGAVGIGSVVAGTGLTSLWGGLQSGPNLIAFGACLAVSCVASWHLRRQLNLSELVSTLSNRTTEAEATIETLRDVVATLRTRVDRTSTSLSFLHDVAARLEGTDPVAAAEGAVDLVLARTGACAAAVHAGIGGFQRPLAVRDARGPKALAPLVLGDADLTAPVHNGNDRVGAIVLWGIAPGGLDDATAHDLAVIASWCGPVIASAAWRPEEAAARAREAS